jgi:hypothetical protein
MTFWRSSAARAVEPLARPDELASNNEAFLEAIVGRRVALHHPLRELALKSKSRRRQARGRLRPRFLCPAPAPKRASAQTTSKIAKTAADRSSGPSPSIRDPANQPANDRRAWLGLSQRESKMLANLAHRSRSSVTP